MDSQYTFMMHISYWKKIYSYGITNLEKLTLWVLHRQNALEIGINHRVDKKRHNRVDVNARTFTRIKQKSYYGSNRNSKRMTFVPWNERNK